MGARLKEMLGKNQLTKVYGLGQFLGPKFVEIVALQGGFDAVWFDHEHAGITTPQIEQAALAARAHGLDSFVRLNPTDYASVMRPLEAGAGGIMASQIRNADQAAQVVNWAKFYPQGLRGLNGLGVDGNFGTLPVKEYLAKANRETFIAIQIEHIEAVNDIERIAALAEVDMLFIGPADLGQSMGIPGDWDQPEIWKAIEKVAHAARKHRIHWGILPINPAFAKRCVDLGCKCLSIGFDSWTVHEGIKSTKLRFAEWF